MNASIGKMHQGNYDSYKYAHLAAIAIGRSNQRILDLAEKIGYDKIVHICVDGIIYTGYGIFGVDDEDKDLGKLVQEYVGAKAKVSKTNVYIVMMDGKCIKFKHGGLNGNISEQEDIKSLDEQYKWTKIDPLKEIKEYAKTLQEE